MAKSSRALFAVIVLAALAISPVQAMEHSGPRSKRAQRSEIGAVSEASKGATPPAFATLGQNAARVRKTPVVDRGPVGPPRIPILFGDRSVRGGEPAKPPGKQKALVVVMENGGFTTGIPDDWKVPSWTCGSFEVATAATATAIDAMTAAQQRNLSRREAAEFMRLCFDPRNWRRSDQPLIPLAAELSDTSIEVVATSLVYASGVADLYDRVEILEDADFTIANVLALLEELAPDYVVDIHTLVHGSDNSFSGTSESFHQDSFFTPLSEIRGLELGTVYQMNCYGSSLIDEWLAVGAKVVNGSQGLNYLPVSYPFLLDRIADGQSFEEAVEGAYDDATPLHEVAFSIVDLYDENDRVRDPILFNALGLLGIPTAEVNPEDEMASSVQLFGYPGDPALDCQQVDTTRETCEETCSETCTAYVPECTAQQQVCESTTAQVCENVGGTCRNVTKTVCGWLGFLGFGCEDVVERVCEPTQTVCEDVTTVACHNECIIEDVCFATVETCYEHSCEPDGDPTSRVWCDYP